MQKNLKSRISLFVFFITLSSVCQCLEALANEYVTDEFTAEKSKKKDLDSALSEGHLVWIEKSAIFCFNLGSGSASVEYIASALWELRCIEMKKNDIWRLVNALSFHMLEKLYQSHCAVTDSKFLMAESNLDYFFPSVIQQVSLLNKFGYALEAGLKLYAGFLKCLAQNEPGLISQYLPQYISAQKDNAIRVFYYYFNHLMLFANNVKDKKFSMFYPKNVGSDGSYKLLFAEINIAENTFANIKELCTQINAIESSSN